MNDLQALQIFMLAYPQDCDGIWRQSFVADNEG